MDWGALLARRDSTDLRGHMQVAGIYVTLQLRQGLEQALQRR